MILAICGRRPARSGRGRAAAWCQSVRGERGDDRRRCRSMREPSGGLRA